MTPQEAIEDIEKIIKLKFTQRPASLDMAIKALSSDMIHRQDAIDAVCMDGCGLCRDAIEQIGGGND